MLLVTMITGTQAQTPALPEGILSLPDIPEEGWQGAVTPSYYHAEGSFIYVFSAYELYQSVDNGLTWTTQNNGGSTSGSPGAMDPFPASSVFTGFKAATLKGTDKGPYAYRVTNCVAAYAYVKSGSDKKRTITLEAFEVTNDEIATTASATASTESNTDNVIQVADLDPGKEYYVKISQVGTGSGGSSSGNSSYYMIAFEVSKGLTISQQPVSAGYEIGAEATALTVGVVGGTAPYTYQWYQCDDTEKTNPQAISGATEASYTPSTVATGYYFCKVTDSTDPTPTTVESNVATITVSEAAVPTILISASAESIAKGESLTLTATAEGVPAPTIQWYSNTTASSEDGTAIEGATSDSYKPSTATPGTYYYYAVATNSHGASASNVLTIVVTGSNKCELTQVLYSNTFNAFILQPVKEDILYTADDQEVKDGEKQVGDVKTPAANGTVKAFYMEGTEAPTIVSESVTTSEGATYTVEGNTLTVTAEDGTTTSVFDITLEPVTPFTGTSLTFDGTETWLKTGYNNGNSFKEGQGWRLSKNNDSDGRTPKGWNRLYLFIGASKSITLANGGTARNIKVYRNGEQLSTPTSSSSCTIAGDENAPYMIAIVANQTSGDTSFSSITVEGAATTGINTIDHSPLTTDNSVYDLQGRKVLNRNMNKGIFILQGKKIVVK